MAVTRSSTADRRTVRDVHARRGAWRGREFLATAGGQPCWSRPGCTSVHQAKSQDLASGAGRPGRQATAQPERAWARAKTCFRRSPFPERRPERDRTARKIYYLTGGLSQRRRIRRSL